MLSHYTIKKSLCLFACLLSLAPAQCQQKTNIRNALALASGATFAFGLGYAYDAYKIHKRYMQNKAAYAETMKIKFDKAYPKVKAAFAEINTLVNSSPRQQIPDELFQEACDAFTSLTATLGHIRYTAGDLKRDIIGYHINCANLYADSLTHVTKEFADDFFKTSRHGILKTYEETYPESFTFSRFKAKGKDFLLCTGLSGLCLGLRSYLNK